MEVWAENLMTESSNFDCDDNLTVSLATSS